MKHLHRAFFTGLLLCLLLSLRAGAESIHEIRTPEDLLAISEDPAGSYILLNDLDMSSVEWIPVDFSGTLDGAGHSLLNLTVTTVGSTGAVVRDGNQIAYEAGLAGMFARLDHAVIRGLRLVNLRACVSSGKPCLLGGLAGYSEDSLITDCSISGILELRAHEGMFGIAGAVGFGTGTLERCSLDTVLICVDTDPAKDEQFLGGVFGAGFFTVKDCEIRLDAYISEHGYVHSGGITGMLVQYPMGMGSYAELTGSRISGRIRFFEDNSDRRAYCNAEAGEIDRAYGYILRDNDTGDFLRDEVAVSSGELRPETCDLPEYDEEVIPPVGSDFGYTRYTCRGCGYTECDRYTLPE